MHHVSLYSVVRHAAPCRALPHQRAPLHTTRRRQSNPTFRGLTAAARAGSARVSPSATTGLTGIGLLAADAGHINGLRRTLKDETSIAGDAVGGVKPACGLRTGGFGDWTDLGASVGYCAGVAGSGFTCSIHGSMRWPVTIRTA